MGLHHQAKDAKKELLTIRMENNENVSEYYHRIFKLWQKAKTPVEDRVETFLTTMKPGISTSLIGREYTDLKELLETARRIEVRRKDVAHSFPRGGDGKSEKVGNNTNRNQSRTNAGSTPSSSSNVGQKDKVTAPARYTGGHPNDKFGPVNKKPDGWVGEWFDGERYPPKLQPEDREQMIKQRRCWSCRRSGHRGGDPICINHDQKKRANKLVVVPESSDSESDSEKE